MKEKAALLDDPQKRIKVIITRLKSQITTPMIQSQCEHGTATQHLGV
jgi:hypothetical protein